MKTVTLFQNISIDCITKDEILLWAKKIFDNSSSKNNYILCINPEKIKHFKNGNIPIDLIDKSAIRIPDGIGIVWAIHKIFSISIERLTGVDLFLDFLNFADKNKKSIFIYAGKNEVIKEAVRVIERKYKSLNIVGYKNGFINNNESEKLVNEINDLKPDFLFLGLGSPKQEKWVYKNMNRLNVPIIQTIGGSLDTVVNPSMRAPDWIQKRGLEWFFRLIKQPFRFRRQLTLLNFIFKIIFYKK